MKIQEYRDAFYLFSGKVSDITRQLAFAGIAVIWLFKKDANGIPKIDEALVFPGLLIVISLSCDLLQYSVGAAIWRYVYRYKEKAGVSEDVDVEHSPLLEYPIYFFFVIKVVSLIASFALIGGFLFSTWYAQSPTTHVTASAITQPSVGPVMTPPKIEDRPWLPSSCVPAQLPTKISASRINLCTMPSAAWPLWARISKVVAPACTALVQKPSVN